MRQLLSKKLIGYAILIFFILVLSGGILFTVIDNYYVLLAVLIIEYIILILIIFHFFDKYIKPIEKVSRTMDKLLAGNYHARVNQQMNGSLGELSLKINALARNLSELTISEQIQAEQLSTVIENSESGLVLIDEKGYIHVVNRKFISMFGKTPQDYIGYLYYDVLENEQIHHTVQETFLYEKRVKQLFSISPNKEKIYLEIVGAPIFNERNMLKGAVLVIYDITEFKNIELMRKDFVANVSHELKTPITSIKGFAETLLDGAAEEPETREQFLQIIYEESKRIQLLIEDLLNLSRLERDEVELNIAPIQVDQMVEDILPAMYQSAEEKAITVKVQLQKGIMFSADEEKVKQVLVNLLTNAISYTLEKGTVQLDIHEDEEQIRFQVKDSGIGISKKTLPRIFERFYRADKARSRDTGGTGLGLAIVKHIVEVHLGEIEVESEPGKGTSFIVYLPKEQEAFHDQK
jgi:two-component system phosphate regulon sensor histidine kinase PhoR